MADIPTYLSAVASDVLSAFGVPTHTLQITLQHVFEKRRKAARAILIKELKTGKKDTYNIGQIDKAVAMFYRYARAA